LLIDLDPMQVAEDRILSPLPTTRPKQSILCRGVDEIENSD
jgi:hypothetical protein